MRVPPVLFKYTFNCHVAREDHHVVVTLPARQLTLLTCVRVCEQQRTTKTKPIREQYVQTTPRLKTNDISFTHFPFHIRMMMILCEIQSDMLHNNDYKEYKLIEE